MVDKNFLQDDTKLFTPQQVADKLGVSRSAVINWLQTRQLSGYKAGRLWKIDSKDVFHFLQKHIPR